MRMMLDRRSLLLSGLASVFSPLRAEFTELWLFIGGSAKGSGQGIMACKFDGRLGAFGPVKLAVESVNPTFLALRRSGDFLYAANEIDNFKGTSAGALSAFRVKPGAGQLTLINQVSSRGPGPCHVSIDHTGRTLLAANYSGGSVVACPIREDGSLGEATSFFQDTGKGPNAERQEGPHAHSIIAEPGNRFAIAADLGTDELRVYRLDAGAARLTPNDPPMVKLQPGSGPRHFTFHPNTMVAYAIDELDSTVTVFDWNGARGALKPLGRYSTLPAGFKGSNTTAEIVVSPNGHSVYASNRGHNSIAVLRTSDSGRKLELIQNVPTKGKTPRNFVLAPGLPWMLVANQDSDNVVLFGVETDGTLKETSLQISTPKPMCLRFA